LDPKGTIALSFFIYAAAVLNAQQQNDFMPQRSSVAAAVSNVFYGAGRTASWVFAFS
jgi:hypothetical protein